MFTDDLDGLIPPILSAVALLGVCALSLYG